MLFLISLRSCKFFTLKKNTFILYTDVFINETYKWQATVLNCFTNVMTSVHFKHC